jgi:hypothetical protein
VERSTVSPDPSTDLEILAERFQLGIPLLGLDGRPIPLRDGGGRPYEPIEAAILLVESAISGLPADLAETYLDTIIERAIQVEDDGIAAGIAGLALDRRITGVFVSAAVRADLIGRYGEVSPSDLNRATLDWYQVHHVRRAALLAGIDWNAAPGRIA